MEGLRQTGKAWWAEKLNPIYETNTPFIEKKGSLIEGNMSIKTRSSPINTHKKKKLKWKDRDKLEKLRGVNNSI